MGVQPLPFPYIYLRYWGLQNTRDELSPCADLPLSLLVSCGAWRSPTGVLPLHHHHAVVLLLELSSSTSPLPLLDQEGGDVTRLHMC